MNTNEKFPNFITFLKHRGMVASGLKNAPAEVIYINPRWVRMVQPHSANVATIIFSDQTSVNVDEDAYTVMGVLQGNDVRPTP